MDSAHYETQLEQALATLRFGLAKAPEARPQRQLAAGAGSGTPGPGHRFGNAGCGQDSQPGARHSGNVQQPRRAHQARGHFFTEAITPIEETHRAALEANARFKRVNRALGRRTSALAASNQSLKLGVAQRRAVELALKGSGQHSQTLLEESLALQKHLQHLAHRILSVQEDKRKQISHDLQDEIAQTLLGINIRLLTVKKAADRNARNLQKKIATTQRLVNMSVKIIKRFAREFGKHHEP